MARIDDRLIHGQVAHGWGTALRATFFAIVSDALAADPPLAGLYLLAVPEGARGRAVSVAEALTPAFRAEVEAERAVLLFPGTDEPLRLREGEFPLESLNVGGLHHAPGKTEVLPYVFLDDVDRHRLRRLSSLGVRVTAQDLPTNPAHALDVLLSRASG
jgi:mannose/fructose/N-acetylgalactosamine-specific phosphotransferase system component IIB